MFLKCFVPLDLCRSKCLEVRHEWACLSSLSVEFEISLVFTTQFQFCTSLLFSYLDTLLQLYIMVNNPKCSNYLFYNLVPFLCVYSNVYFISSDSAHTYNPLPLFCDLIISVIVRSIYLLNVNVFSLCMHFSICSQNHVQKAAK